MVEENKEENISAKTQAKIDKALCLFKERQKDFHEITYYDEIRTAKFKGKDAQIAKNGIITAIMYMRR